MALASEEPRKHVVAVDVDEVLCKYSEGFVRWHNARTSYPPADVPEVGVCFKTACSKANSQAREEFALEPDFVHIERVPGAKEALERLNQLGVRVEAVTSRPASMASATRAYLASHFPDLLADSHFAKSGEKGQICKRIGATVLVDDQLRNIHDAVGAGVNAVLFDLDGTYTWNNTAQAASTLPRSVVRLKSWESVLGHILQLLGLSDSGGDGDAATVADQDARQSRGSEIYRHAPALRSNSSLSADSGAKRVRKTVSFEGCPEFLDPPADIQTADDDPAPRLSIKDGETPLMPIGEEGEEDCDDVDGRSSRQRAVGNTSGSLIVSGMPAVQAPRRLPVPPSDDAVPMLLKQAKSAKEIRPAAQAVAVVAAVEAEDTDAQSDFGGANVSDPPAPTAHSIRIPGMTGVLMRRRNKLPGIVARSPIAWLSTNLFWDKLLWQLSDSCLEFWASESNWANGLPAAGTLLLSELEDLTVGINGQELAFTLSPATNAVAVADGRWPRNSQRLLLRARTRKDAEKWMEAIQFASAAVYMRRADSTGYISSMASASAKSSIGGRASCADAIVRDALGTGGQQLPPCV